MSRPPLPKASEACTTATFFCPSSSTRYLAMTLALMPSWGRKRNTHWCRCGSGRSWSRRSRTGILASLMVGSIAWIWVERLGVITMTISGSSSSFWKAATAPGLVVWSSSRTIWILRPLIPPAALIWSAASSAPCLWYLPDSAASPVMAMIWPILIGLDWAWASPNEAPTNTTTASPTIHPKRVRMSRLPSLRTVSSDLSATLDRTADRPPMKIDGARVPQDWG